MLDIHDVLGCSFNTAHQEPAPERQKYDILPPGEHGNAIISKTPEMLATKKKTGYYVKIEFQFVDGPYVGRKVWDRINIVNKSAKCQQIGRSNMTELCKAAGVLDMNSLYELTGKIVRPVVKVDGEYNKITGYKPAQSPGFSPPPVQQPAPAPAPVAAPSVPPQYQTPPAAPAYTPGQALPWANPQNAGGPAQ